MASANITFDTIPASIRKPGKYFEFNTRLAVNTLPANLQAELDNLAAAELKAATARSAGMLTQISREP